MIQVLSIGNSFSQDAQRYLHDIARVNGDEIETVNLYIGGCTLSRHFRNIRGDLREYELQVDGHAETGFYVSVKEALLAREWDYVTIQQGSGSSYKFETYEPYLSALAAYVRELCPKAKLLLHETWAYASGSNMIREHGYETFEEMFRDVELAYRKAAAVINADGIIPCGEVMLEAQKVFPKVHRDSFHASYGLGRFLLALTFYGYLTGKDVKDVEFNMFDEPVSEDEFEQAEEIVDRVLGDF